ncbi:acetylglutamate kinase [Candidatus Termititenax persephonae]|uniref:Acetylglutamate kinase n=1 Tax=Candidatus Termititenax persephonae TaxID=2218525 RepID=A0A388TF60_9BACT|nr:acetylglutamate kinase [Candidatus Termititenax persephonae]
MQKFQDKVEVILDALPYIRKFQGAIVVIKYGGSAMTDPRLKREVARDIALLNYIGMKPVVVHGGGKEINSWLDKIGKKAEFAPNGLRVTDKETMELAEMVLGRIGKEIVELLHREGETRAVSLSGKDGGLFVAEKLQSEYDLGYVGEIKTVNAEIVHELLSKDFIPVISSVAMSRTGETYNINADIAACKIAKELEATKLYLMTDVDGVLDGNKKLIQRIDKKKAEELLESKVIAGGMIPKIKSALDVLSIGVKSVHIINGTVEHSLLLETLTSQGIGTMVTWD